jgi:hypothetical protein
MIEMGIEVLNVFDSKIFNFTFDFDEWPSIHTNEDSCLRPYNDSLYKIMSSYSIVFPEEEFQEIELDFNDKAIQSDKFYKIKYSINLLPLVGQHIDLCKDLHDHDKIDSCGDEKNHKNKHISFFETCTNSNELNMFKSQALQDVIDFKWNEFGFNFHLVGSMIHMVQMSILIFYINYVYITGSLEVDEAGKIVGSNPSAIVLLTGIIYPMCYSIV